jgi:hypothetical protein
MLLGLASSFCFFALRGYAGTKQCSRPSGCLLQKEKYDGRFCSSHEFTRGNARHRGGKGANLSQLARAGFPVPSRFLISTAAYQAFVQENDLQKQIEALARSGTATNFEEVSLEQRQNACCVHCVIFWCVGCSSWGRATLPMSMTPPSTSSASWHLCGQPCLRPGSGSPTGEL